MQTYQHTSMQTYHYGDIYCRVYFSFQRKAEQSFPFTKAKQACLLYTSSAETALATSVLFLVPGVPLINGVIDIVEGHILIGCSRLINALLLIICIAIGLSATLLMVKDGLL